MLQAEGIATVKHLMADEVDSDQVSAKLSKVISNFATLCTKCSDAWKSDSSVYTKLDTERRFVSFYV